MKRPYPDLGETQLAAYLDRLSFVRKFVKYWGTTTVDGVEVLRSRNYYYNGSYIRHDRLTKLLKFLGMYNKVYGSRMKGVDYAWLFLNPAKSDYSGVKDDLIAGNLNKAVWDKDEPEPEDLTLKLNLLIGGNYDYGGRRYSPPPISSPVSDQNAIIDEIKSNYTSLWETETILARNGSREYTSSTEYVRETLKADRYRSILTKYLLFSEEIPYTITKVTPARVEINYSYRTTVTCEDTSYYGVCWETRTATKLGNGYRVEIELPYFYFYPTTDLVQTVLSEFSLEPTENRSNNWFGSISAITSAVTDSSSSSDVVYTPPTISLNEEIWKNDNGTYLLRVDALLTPKFKLQDRIDLISSVIDNDYEEEDNDGGWFSSVLSIIIIVVAVVLAIPSGGSSLAIAYGIALGVTLGSLAVSLISAALMQAGYEETAMGMAEFNRGIEPLVQIASIVLIVIAIGKIATAAQAAAKEAAKEAATQKAVELITEKGLEDVTKKMFEEMVSNYAESIMQEQFYEMVWAGVKDQFVNLIGQPSTNLNMENTMKVVNMAFDYYQKNKLGELRDKISETRADITKFTEEQAQTNHILMAINTATFKPLKADWSIYASVYDRPYERWSTGYHSGNIQSNSVSALWFSDNK